MQIKDLCLSGTPTNFKLYGFATVSQGRSYFRFYGSKGYAEIGGRGVGTVVPSSSRLEVGTPILMAPPRIRKCVEARS
jgi:hypothetical protein